MNTWLDLLVRRARAPSVSIASIRGRARGAGVDFVFACDPRFASRKNILLGGLESEWAWSPGAARWPGSQFPGLVSRGRALEMSSSARTSTDHARSSTDMSIGSSPTSSSTRGRSDRRPTRALRSRGDRGHQVIRRPGEAAAKQRVPRGRRRVPMREVRPAPARTRSSQARRRVRGGSVSRACRTPCADATPPSVG